MELGMMVLVVLLVLFVLMAAEVPVAFSLACAGALGMILLSGMEIAGTQVARQPYLSTARYTLIVIPMFIAMGVFAKQGGMAEGVFRLAARGLRRIPGGLALAALFACAGFAAVSGSSVATVVSVGRLSIQEMRKHGYDPAFACGVVGAAGTLGVLIPPSVILVIYGILTGESIGALLIGGIIPGIFSAMIYAGAIMWRAYRHPELAGVLARATEPPPRPISGGSGDASPEVVETEQEDILETKATGGWGGLFRIGILFIIVVGGIYSGQFTAIESAAMGAVAALVILLFDSARIGMAVLWQRFRDSIVESVSINSMIFMLLIGAGLFTAFTVSAGVPQAFTRWALGFDLPATLIVIVLLAAFIPLGMFLDPISIMLIGVPLAYPVITSLGFDGLWFGIMIVKTVEIGFITPPLGINAYVVAGVAEDVSVETVFKGVLWFLPADLITLALLFAFPAIVTWLPSAIR